MKINFPLLCLLSLGIGWWVGSNTPSVPLSTTPAKNIGVGSKFTPESDTNGPRRVEPILQVDLPSVGSNHNAEIADVTTAIDRLATMPRSKLNIDLLFVTFKKLGFLDAASALKLLGKFSVVEQKRLIRAIVEGWSTKDVESAWTWVSTSDSSDPYDPDHLFQSLKSNDLSISVLDKLILIKGAHEALQDLVKAQGKSPNWDLFYAAIPKLAVYDLDGLTAVAGQVSDRTVRINVIAKIGAALMKEDPILAGDYVFGLAPSDQSYAANIVFGEWARTMPRQTVLDWISSKPDGPARVAIVKSYLAGLEVVDETTRQSFAKLLQP